MMQALREDISPRELERKISDMKRDRVRIEDTIRRMEANQQRIFREQDARNGTQTEEADEKSDPGEKEKGRERHKRRRSRSGSGSDSESKKSDKEANGDKEDKGGKEDKAENADNAGEAKEGERKKPDRDGRPKKPDPRSRNLFGKLLGHLHSAKTRLETEKGSKAAELNAKAQERIEEKLSLSKMNIKEFRKGQYEQRKKEEEGKVAQLEKDIEAMETLLLQKRLEGHYSLMMNYIRTKAEPTIFFLPAKHTKDTEHQLEETRAAIKHKIASLRGGLQPAPGGDEDALRASAAAAAVAEVEAPEAPSKQEGTAEEAKEDDGDKKDEADGASTSAKDKPESDKKPAPSDDEEDKEEKEAAADKGADSDAGSPKKRKASADDSDSKSKKRKGDASESESGR